MHSIRRGLAASLLVLLAACHGTRTAAPPAQAAGESKAGTVRVIALNDFHGYLEPSPFHPEGATGEVLAGGAVAVAGTVERLRAEQPHAIVVGAGDLVGASPLTSSLLHDEPSIDALDRMGMNVTAVGNHEFDHGRDELLRLQKGGCPVEGCASGQAPFPGAKYTYLAANIFDSDTGERPFPAYAIREVAGRRIAFIGAVLEGAPEIIIPDHIKGLVFADEADSINAVVPEIEAQGVHAMVVLIHEGGVPHEVDQGTCAGVEGPILDIVRRLDRDIDVVVSAHTHREYICKLDGRLVTQGGSYGHVVTSIDLAFGADGDIASADARNVITDPKQPSNDPAYAQIVADAKARTAEIAQRPIARLGVAQIRRTHDKNGESELGRFLADVQLEAAAKFGARIACMNPGGVRQHLPAVPKEDEPVRFSDLQAVHPFGNRVTVLELTGAQLRAMLEQQWQKQAPEGILMCSKGFSYEYDLARPLGARVVGAVLLDGKPIDPAAHYRIAVNSFLAGGGDSYPVFKEARVIADAGLDLDALIAYLKAHEPAKPLDDVRARMR